jgi:uncharacterized damage-inducible protein DinB
MATRTACDALLSQFKSSWNMLRQAIDKVPEGSWNRTNNDWTFSDTVYHIITTQEFYFRDTPEGMGWGRMYGDPKYKADDPEKYYPSKQILLEYQGRLESEICEYLGSKNDSGLEMNDGFKEWLPNVHVKFLYLLRHNAHHIGELARMLREWDAERVSWV